MILFVYGIGIQVGSLFFFFFKKDGLRFNLLSLSTIAISGLIAYGVFVFGKLSIENTVGLLSGAVTITPGLGATKSVIQELQTQFADKKFSNPTTTYAITYSFRVFGIILVIIFSKKVFWINIEVENRSFEEKVNQKISAPIHRKCRVTNPEGFGKTLRQILEEIGKDKVIFSRLKHSVTMMGSKMESNHYGNNLRIRHLEAYF